MQNNYNYYLSKLLVYQIILLIIFIIFTFLSIILSYNDYLETKKKDPILNKKEYNFLLKLVRITFVLCSIGFLFINYYNKENIKFFSKYNYKKLNGASYLVIASILSLISNLILLAKTYSDDNPLE